MRALDGDCTAEFGRCEGQSWYGLIGRFRDASVYQTPSYDTVRYGRRGVTHMILRQGSAVVAAAQARIVRLPGTRAGIAYVRWGPMWRCRDGAEDLRVFRQAMRALRNELSERRGLVLRVYPVAYRGQDEALVSILEQEGYVLHGGGRTDRTLIIDLEPSLEELRAALDQKWRNCLNRAEKNGLEVISGEDEGLFDEIARMHGEMTARKGLAATSDIGHLRRVQRELPPGLKLRVVVCRRDGEACAGAIMAAVGTTGVYVRGATSDTGLQTKGSYLVQWTFVRWLKEHGFRHYDLNGINPATNPGTYHFKRGLAGRRGRDVELLGRFQVADSRVSHWVVKSGEWLVAGYRQQVDVARSAFASPGTAT